MSENRVTLVHEGGFSELQSAAATEEEARWPSAEADVAIGTPYLDPLSGAQPLSSKLVAVHGAVKSEFPFVARIAIALADPRTGMLKAYLHSSGGDDPLPHYQAELSDAPSLAAMFEARRPRVVNDLAVFAEGQREHTRRIRGQGYRASYTVPMFANDVFFGFIFMNSYEKGVFNPRVTRELSMYGHLIVFMIVSELSALRTLVATVSGAVQIAKTRDPESGGHLDRMSRYARQVARCVAMGQGLSGEFVERIFAFAPLHDIGKMGIPDDILMKPGPLSESDWKVMRSHPARGLELIDGVLRSAGLSAAPGIEILRHIVHCHHERMDGSGYPQRLKGHAIPLEARIVAVADVWDALTSSRPYKEPWNFGRAEAEMRSLAGNHLDPACVDALLSDRTELERIRERFSEGSAVEAGASVSGRSGDVG